jgi:amino acid adenylation domain-containing protein
VATPPASSTSARRASAARLGTAAGLLFDALDDHADRPAVWAGGARTAPTDYATLAARTLGIAQLLRDGGVAPGDRVAIFLPRGVDAIASYFAVLAAGGAAVILNERLRARQIEHVVGHSGAQTLIACPRLLGRLPRPPVTAAHVVDPADAPADEVDGPGPAHRSPGDLAQVIYTSGSTGMPKGVAISHANLWAGVDAVVEYLRLGPDDRIASLLPLSFDYGLNQALCAAATGAALVVETSPVPPRIVRSLRDHEVSVVAAVPPLWLQVLQVAAFVDQPLPSLRILTNTGGRLPTSAVRALRRAQPQAHLFLMYGLTEAFRSTYLPPGRVDEKPTSVGRPIPGAEILVVDENDRACPPGQVGQLVHRGPTVALGYWNDPSATAAVFRPNPQRPLGTPDVERVVFSGDLAYQDADGDLFFVGREDTMIKSLGYRVSPDEVADVLYASGEVAEVAVTAEPDDLKGSRIVAHVVLTARGDVERLQAFSAAELPRWMVPDRIDVRRSLPRTPSGKHHVAAMAAGRP